MVSACKIYYTDKTTGTITDCKSYEIVDETAALFHCFNYHQGRWTEIVPLEEVSRITWERQNKTLWERKVTVRSEFNKTRGRKE